MKVLVGLGNPGEKYERNRHNVGFMAVDAIAERHGGAQWRKRFQGLAAEIDIGRTRYLLLKPGTYMNESGRSVSEAVRFYKMSPADVIVLHDEIDLEPGKIRVKFGGGHAGHNGLKSISAHIGNDYQRVRIGVGHPGNREAVAGYVLHDFAKADREWLEPLLTAIGQGAAHLVGGNDAKFMNEVARAGRPVTEKPKAAPAAKPAPVVAAAPAAKPEPPEAAPPSVEPVTAASVPTPAQAEPVAAAPAPKPAQPAPKKAEPKREPAFAGAGRAPQPETSLGAKLVAWLRRN
ncbi:MULTISPECIES: aminoacyl-tRNA hydrolase [Rhodomicrobium]|uniref:aminoacyl-tRNA hydrolase n=1 Tax=Rhodomicrobium TaxID=1068 RepID=UPI000B4B0C8A|nr:MULTISPECIES: aminoacyl-tRNA hydrolase [Rhodomicrobium]